MKPRAATEAVRDELLRVRTGRACDRRAELAGLLRSAGTFHVHGGGRFGLEVSTEQPGVARRLFQALRDALGARGEVRLLEPGRGHPRARYAVHVDGVSLQRFVEAGVLDEGGAPTARVPRRLVTKRCCAAAYLRGAFLARGSVGDPRGSPHLEIRVESDDAAEDVVELLARLGITARAREHRGWAVYVKSVPAIGTILAVLGAHDAYLRWESGSVLRNVHADAARLANADAANARRVATAAARQLAAIDEVEERVGLRALPPALREAAELRRENPSASFEELARACSPPITKAALADRFRRLVALAER